VSVFILMRNAYLDEFDAIVRGRQLFLVFQSHERAPRESDVVTIREVDDATGEKTGRQVIADAGRVVPLTIRNERQGAVVSIMPRHLRPASLSDRHKMDEIPEKSK
jgi:hypothetical protein